MGNPSRRQSRVVMSAPPGRLQWRRMPPAIPRLQTARRGGALGTTAALVAVAASSAAMLAVGPRVLGPVAFGAIALAWTASTIFGYGLAAPTEQVISRRLNVGASHAITAPVLALCAAAIAFGFLVAPIEFHLSRAGEYRDSLAITGAAIGGWVLAASVRGRLAGLGDLTAYSGVWAIEALVRFAMVGAALTFRGHATWLLAGAVCVPVLAAGGLGYLVLPGGGAAVARVGRLVTPEQLAFVAVSVGIQLCVNGPALLVGWRASSAATVSAFVSANSYFRAPTILMGGLATYTLVTLSHAWGLSDGETFRTTLRRSVAAAGALGVTSTVALYSAAPFLLRAYYGRRTGLPTHLLAALAASSCALVVAGVAVQALLAVGSFGKAVLCWLSAGAVTTVIVAMSRATDRTASLALVAGPTLALATAIWSLGCGRSVRILHRDANAGQQSM